MLLKVLAMYQEEDDLHPLKMVKEKYGMVRRMWVPGSDNTHLIHVGGPEQSYS